MTKPLNFGDWIAGSSIYSLPSSLTVQPYLFMMQCDLMGHYAEYRVKFAIEEARKENRDGHEPPLETTE